MAVSGGGMVQLHGGCRLAPGASTARAEPLHVLVLLSSRAAVPGTADRDGRMRCWGTHWVTLRGLALRVREAGARLSCRGTKPRVTAVARTLSVRALTFLTAAHPHRFHDDDDGDDGDTGG